jgi:hypothetical protein
MIITCQQKEVKTQEKRKRRIKEKPQKGTHNHHSPAAKIAFDRRPVSTVTTLTTSTLAAAARCPPELFFRHATPSPRLQLPHPSHSQCRRRSTQQPCPLTPQPNVPVCPQAVIPMRDMSCCGGNGVGNDLGGFAAESGTFAMVVSELTWPLVIYLPFCSFRVLL